MSKLIKNCDGRNVRQYEIVTRKSNSHCFKELDDLKSKLARKISGGNRKKYFSTQHKLLTASFLKMFFSQHAYRERG